MKKQILSVFLILSIISTLITALPVFASTEPITEACGDNVNWTFDNGTLTISGTGPMWDKDDIATAIPWESTGIPLTTVIIEDGVTEIGDKLFWWCFDLESVTIPDSVTSIGEGTFDNCNLTELVIPDSVTYIGERAFADCDFTTLVIPDSITDISHGAFEGCNKMESLTLGKNTITIGENAFGNCKKLTEISFPSTLESIEDYAFEWCESITSITIPEGVTTLAEGAFYGCKKLEDIILPDGITNFGVSNPYNSINISTYANPFLHTTYYDDENNWENGILYIDNYLIDVKTDTEGEVTVRDGIKYVNDVSFCKCKNITKIIMPESLESINYRAFYDCTSLTEVVTGDNINHIGKEAFNNTPVYSNSENWENDILYVGKYLIKANDTVTNVEVKPETLCIADYAFYQCEDLSDITVPETVKYIGNYAFYGCINLLETGIHDKIVTIGDLAYSGCRTIHEAHIPDSVTYLGESAFSNCGSVGCVNIGSGITELKDKTFTGCSISNLVIPDNIKSIGNSVFYSCSGLKSLTISYGVETIGDYAFYFCSSLEEITIPDSVISIGEWSFSATSAKTINIGKGLKDICGLGAFLYSRNLLNINVDTENSHYLSLDGVLLSRDGSLLIQYPIGREDLEYTVPDCVKTIGVGAIYNASKLQTLNIPDSVITIGQEAAASCYNLKNINLGKSVETIGRGAFSNSHVLSEIVIPDSVKEIGMSAFSSNIYLSSVIMGKNVTEIGKRAFVNCGMTDINLPATLESIGEEAFKDCTNLKEINIPKNTVTIGEGAFINCTSLEKIVVAEENPQYCSVDDNLFTKDMRTMVQYAIGKTDTDYSVPKGVINIGDYAFYSCADIVNIILPDGLNFIGEHAFSFCDSLITLYIPYSVNDISRGVIADDCENFGNIYYGGNQEEWKAIDFYYCILNMENVTIHYNYKYFTEDTKIVYDGETTTVCITPPNELSGKYLVFGLYQNGVLTAVKTAECINSLIKLSFTESHDEIKILYWNDLTSASPFTSAEVIPTDKWISDVASDEELL